MDKYKHSNGQWKNHPEWVAAYLIDGSVRLTQAKQIEKILLQLHPGPGTNLEKMVLQALTEADPGRFGNKNELVLKNDGCWAYSAQWMIREKYRPKDWIIPISRYMLADKLDLI